MKYLAMFFILGANASLSLSAQATPLVQPQDISTTITNSTFSFAGAVNVGTTTNSTALTVYGLITSSSTMGTIACNAGTGTLSTTATDQHGTFTAGASAANCTYTFKTPWPKTPDCICADDSSILAIKATASRTSVICTASVTMSGDNITYFCWGAP